MYRAAVRFVSVGLLALSMAACLPATLSPAAPVGRTAPDIRGTITQIEAGRSADALGQLRIEGVKEADTNYDKAVAAITNSTVLYVQEGTQRRPAAYGELKEGQQVEAWFTGPVALSYPVQGGASQVVILAGATPGGTATLPAADAGAPATAGAPGEVTAAPGPTAEPPAAASLARETLAGQLQLAADAVKVLSAEPVEWPDACLGVAVPDTMCAQVITPGYRVVLEAGGKQYELHTDMTGSNVKLANP